MQILSKIIFEISFFCDLTGTRKAKLSLGTLSVIVEPAAINTPSPTVTGATKLVLHPINASLPTTVLNLLTPS